MNALSKRSGPSNRLFKCLSFLIVLTALINFLHLCLSDDKSSSRDGLNLRNFVSPSRVTHIKNTTGHDHIISHNDANIGLGVKPDVLQKKPIVFPTKTENRTTVEVTDGKNRVRQILQKAGIKITPEVESIIPDWSEVTSLYGSKPKIMGLETCSDYRNSIPFSDRMIGPAGIFNTGTNLLAKLLGGHCDLPGVSNTPMLLFQVPWGKHNPTALRLHHTTPSQKHVNQSNVLPVVTIKDPYHWMGSMCRHTYQANWHHTDAHCPNLVATEADVGYRGIRKKDIGKPIDVKVRFQPTIIPKYDSLAGLWNDWYMDYIAVDSFPRLIIRFEDLLFHLEEVIKEVCECVGGTATEDMSIIADSAKGDSGPHSGSGGLLSAIKRYGHKEQRLEGMNKDDIKYARNVLIEDTMKVFGYSYPEES